MFCTLIFSGRDILVHAVVPVISVFFHNPPLIPPAITVLLVLSVGSKMIAFVLPPTLFGPLSTHGLSAPSPGVLFKRACCLFFSNSSLILERFSPVGLPNSGFAVNAQSCSKYLFGGNPSAFLSDLDIKNSFLNKCFSKNS